MNITKYRSLEVSLEKTEKVDIGDFIKDKYDWHIVIYVYDSKTVRAVGLGKSDSYILPTDEITEIRKKKSFLSTFMDGRTFIWYNKKGGVYVSEPIVHQTDGVAYQMTENAYRLTRAINDIGEPEWGKSIDTGYTYQYNNLIMGEDITDRFDTWSDILDHAIGTRIDVKNETLEEVKFEVEDYVEEKGPDIIFEDAKYFIMLDKVIE